MNCIKKDSQILTTPSFLRGQNECYQSALTSLHRQLEVLPLKLVDSKPNQSAYKLDTKESSK